MAVADHPVFSVKPLMPGYQVKAADGVVLAKDGAGGWVLFPVRKGMAHPPIPGAVALAELRRLERIHATMSRFPYWMVSVVLAALCFAASILIGGIGWVFFLLMLLSGHLAVTHLLASEKDALAELREAAPPGGEKDLGVLMLRAKRGESLARNALWNKVDAHRSWMVGTGTHLSEVADVELSEELQRVTNRLGDLRDGCPEEAELIADIIFGAVKGTDTASSGGE